METSTARPTLCFQRVEGKKENRESSPEQVLMCDGARTQRPLAFPDGGKRVNAASQDQVGHALLNPVPRHQTLCGTVQRTWVGPLLCNFSGESPRTTSATPARPFPAAKKVMSRKVLLPPSHSPPRFLRTVLGSPAHTQSPGVHPNH